MNEAEDYENLEYEIDNLAESKGNALSDDAKRAHLHYESIKDHLDHQTEEDEYLDESIIQVKEFNENVRILTEIFRKSNLDEYIYLLANPAPVMLNTLIMGIIKGVGVAFGIILVIFLLLASIGESLPQLLNSLGL